MARREHALHLRYCEDFREFTEKVLRSHLQSGQNEPLVIFMHLAGSHFPWRDAVPQEKQVYKQAELAINETKETLRNSYDNSILFTDSILKEIIENLKNSNRSACLFYFSDHGDSPSSGRERDVTSNEIWNIPAIIWGNKFFWRDYPDVKEYLSEKQNKNNTADSCSSHGERSVLVAQADCLNDGR